MQQHQHFTAVEEPDAWATFRVKIWLACSHPCKYPYRLMKWWWWGIWGCNSCYVLLDTCIKPSCTSMLICTVRSDVLIILLLKTCLHYPRDARNFNAAFPVKFDSMGTMRFSVCSLWLVGWQQRCTHCWKRPAWSLRAPQGAGGVTVSPESSFLGGIETTSILALAFSQSLKDIHVWFHHLRSSWGSATSVSQNNSGSVLMVWPENEKYSAWMND